MQNSQKGTKPQTMSLAPAEVLKAKDLFGDNTQLLSLDGEQFNSGRTQNCMLTAHRRHVKRTEPTETLLTMNT